MPRPTVVPERHPRTILLDISLQNLGARSMQDLCDTGIHREIFMARVLHEQYGGELLADPRVLEFLGQYRGAIEKTGKAMREMGVHRACASCAGKGSGSCCFPGIEEGYDHVLLLINLLLGHSVPDAGEFPGSCMFVGDRGCKLFARYYFCVHFLCPGLHEVLDPVAVKALLRLVGEELHAGWELEQVLRSG
ncbi:MAG: hypothetical protein HGA84_06680, partial [Syntrophobacteraceae bacterium]|nr:hypothetical protein [Syntrophobacteraceae bacterium]